MDEAMTGHLRDLFAALGTVSARAMFGGHGLYVDGLIIGIVFDGMLYLKTDAGTRFPFEAAGGHPFEYVRKGQVRTTTYWSVPADALDSPAAMRPWAVSAIEAARRKPTPTPLRGRSR